jgi:3-oxoadipate enol-lactonase
VGIAVGGSIALPFAARHPGRTRVVTAGSPATGIAPDHRAAVLERVAKIEAAGMAFAVEESMRDGYPSSFALTSPGLSSTGRNGSATIRQSYATVSRMPVATEMHDELTRLNCPTLVIDGSLDRTRPPTSPKPWPTSSRTPTGHSRAVPPSDIIFDRIDAFLIPLFTQRPSP